MAAKLNVPLTDNFRLVSDGERNYMLEELVTVDPTKAPGYKPPTDGSVPSTRSEWRGIERYWPLNNRGLAGAIEYAMHRQAHLDGASTMGTFIRRLHDLSTLLHKDVGVGD